MISPIFQDRLFGYSKPFPMTAFSHFKIFETSPVYSECSNDFIYVITELQRRNQTMPKGCRRSSIYLLPDLELDESWEISEVCITPFSRGKQTPNAPISHVVKGRPFPGWPPSCCVFAFLSRLCCGFHVPTFSQHQMRETSPVPPQ